jgi:hypothetical protein
MPTDSQLSANRANAQHSTGPTTEAGKAASSQNALTHGLFTLRDFIQPGEEAEYAQFTAAYLAELSPLTLLEQTYAAALVSAAWRLRRCSLVESNMSDYIAGDPMENGFGQKMQTSVDRARAQAFNIFRRSTQELRRLQTDRALRAHIPTGASAPHDLTSPQQFVTALAHARRAKLVPFEPVTSHSASFCNLPESAPAPSGPEQTLPENSAWTPPFGSQEAA